MSVATALAALLLLSGAASQATSSDRYLLSLRGAPVGVVALAWNAATGEYRYRSTHLFTRGESRDALHREEATVLDGNARGPDALARASFALWRGRAGGLPSAGRCAEVHDELRGRARLCVDASAGAEVSGRQDAAVFRARYAADGRLQTLELEGARLTRLAPSAQLSWPEDVLAQTLPVTGPPGGALAAVDEKGAQRCGPDQRCVPSPEAKAASGASREQLEQLDREVAGSFDQLAESSADLKEDAAATVGSCLARARRWVSRARRQGVEASLLCGVYVAPGSDVATPHAWVRTVEKTGAGAVEVERDPTLGVTPGPRTHLALGGCADETGARLLRLYEGSLKLTRSRSE